jgi:hypothetical protein
LPGIEEHELLEGAVVGGRQARTKHEIGHRRLSGECQTPILLSLQSSALRGTSIDVAPRLQPSERTLAWKASHHM